MATYFVTGASGYIGGSVAAELVRAGDVVRGLVRNPQTAKRLHDRGITPVLGSLDDKALLISEARLSDGVINCASADDGEAVLALIDGLEGTNKPLVHTSGSSVIADDARGNLKSDKIFDEDTPLLVHPMKQARHDIDLNMMSAAQRGIRSAVICPSLIYGVGRGLNQSSVQIPFLVEQARRLGRVPIVGAGLNVWSNVHIDDVVDLYVLALRKSSAGAFYFAENGEASFLELGQTLAARLQLPGIVSVAAEDAAKQWGAARAYFSLGGNSRVRATRARRELGWMPQHRSALEWIKTEMMI
ncbi:MAG: NAD-dependent epimerase/dehydratase family protein [Hyphomicrobiaceae bacterium]